MLVWVVIIVLAILVIKGNVLSVSPDNKKKNPDAMGKGDDPQESEVFSVEGAYQSKWMFTQNEKVAYHKLNEIAKKHNLVVFAKVRLFDLVEPVRNHPKYKTNLYKIQAKHVDFVLTKSNLVARYVVELDDGSHGTKERAERDAFVDKVLTSCGYKVLHTKDVSEEEIVRFININ